MKKPNKPGMLTELYYSIRRFFIIASGGYTRYSDYPDFYKKVALERRRMDYEKKVCGRYLLCGTGESQ